MTELARPLLEDSACELTILMPCLNEVETLGACIDKAQQFLAFHGISGEVLIADNGSTDGSGQVAREHGARIVSVAARGYGSALMAGIEGARGSSIIMGDADDSYDFSQLMPFVDKLRDGYELVMGNRFKGGIAAGAMPPLHKYLGNPLLTYTGRLFFGSQIGDFHCGLRGFRRDSILQLQLQTTGMEFASEMVVKAALNRLRMTEVPTTLSPDGRSRRPHLRSWRDGWRHLRFLLIYSPRWLFFYPGIALMLAGGGLLAWLTPEPRTIGTVTFDIHTMLYAAVAVVCGFNIVCYAIFAKVFAANARLMPAQQRLYTFVREATLERGLVLGLLLFVAGLAGSINAFLAWRDAAFGPLVPSSMMRITIPSLTALAVGLQIVFASFFLSTLDLQRKPPVP